MPKAKTLRYKLAKATSSGSGMIAVRIGSENIHSEATANEITIRKHTIRCT